MTQDVILRGACLRLWKEWQEYDEILIDGPAGTGKSMGVAFWLDDIAETYPGARVLVCRKTRVSLTQSWMQTFRKALRMAYPGGDKDYLFDGPTDATRTEYRYRNWSKIVLGGMDNATRLFSTEYDVCYVNEANELTEAEWESLHRALRNGVVPRNLLLGDCNPDSKFHWLYRRMGAGTTARFRSRHEDNPFLTDTEEGRDYLNKLRTQLSGVRYQRLYEGEWCIAAGAIWPEFSDGIHVLRGKLSKPGRFWELEITKGLGATLDQPKKVELTWFFGAQDWGFVNPGCLQCWGVDRDGRIYLVREWYQTGQTHDWWAERAVKCWKEFGMSPCVCDGAEKAGLKVFNDRLSHIDQHAAARFALDAIKDVQAGLDVVRDRLLPQADGSPRIFFLEGALAHDPDPELTGESVTGFVRPTRTYEEIPGYVYEEIPPEKLGEKEDKERPRKVNDHGCDAMRYACMYAWARDHTPNPEDAEYQPGTWGKLLNLKEKFRD
jgi:phage terminase large subunit